MEWELHALVGQRSFNATPTTSLDRPDMYKGEAMMKHDWEEHQHLINIRQEPFMKLSNKKKPKTKQKQFKCEDKRWCKPSRQIAAVKLLWFLQLFKANQLLESQ